ncbi:STN and carboxypeptidase regulatory-like domain-containing protein [Mucilaginibacter sp. L3T2-6]|uniref:STN and carboxypeptidase regulatory-like domain-containing protein n=1 Tax=Mucilaginibacter sp. L3T2-6 TaxID=3062491 RepID=UPI0026763E3D|nr:STN and carboxypeptidase regulatory-like domain-containing protein [Mucilaginibacter sp. L3T2-6]MDO3642082.1 STN and carboxypeptidase regulatory-like domain-containing protein [Mucilaginibacter sp. L3T2-6]MDV6214576.1 STN and carboxypeptidase regulatory-like domain-containing protein [Mucilaginibacter sp. L3T2-6]
MHFKLSPGFRVGLLLFFVVALLPCHAQSVLNRNITMNVTGQRLGSVLRLMEERGKFQFSYNSNLIKQDSVVDIHVANQTVKDALDKLLSNRFEYREAENFVILRYAPMQLKMVTDKFSTEGQTCIISGYVADEQNGRKLENASVFSRRTLESTLTSADGHFELKVKNESQPVVLTVSKENYKDTSVIFLSELKVINDNQSSASSNSGGFSYLPGDLSKVENTRLGRLFVTSKQKIQSLNLGGLIKEAPFQASLVPGLGTHGSLSGQVVNTVSLNLAGGYNAGVNGAEIGLFNLDKSDVKSFQLGVLFNTVGGSVKGVQIGGAFNQVLSDVKAVQIGGAFNNAEGEVDGIQAALAFNNAGGLNGFQSAALNITSKKSSGIQFGLMNIAEQEFRGIQIGGLFNYAKNLHGIQLGLINASDYSSGFSLGFINLVQHGYQQLIVNSNESTDLNVLYKTGTRYFYNVLLAGTNLRKDKKLYAYGLGYGNELPVFNFLAFNTEITARNLNQGSGRYLNLLWRIDESINIKVGPLKLMAGPSLNFYYNQQPKAIPGYIYVPDLPNHYPTNNPKYTRWIGWTVGVGIFN